MQKLNRSQLKVWVSKTAKEQGYLDPISGKPLDMKVPRGICADHDHFTGQLRGVLNRATNAAEGKVANAVARWGGVGHNYPEIIAWLRRMCDYLEQEQKPFIYPEHRTPEEKKAADNAKRRKVRAQTKAKRQVRSYRREHKDGA